MLITLRAGIEMKLNELKSNPGAVKSRMRVGRGIGSGKGKTCGSGQKGQKSRTGVSINGFEGGQNPLYRRLPKRGFNNIFRKEVEIVNLGNLQEFVEAGKIKADNINKDSLAESGLIRKSSSIVKLLGNGEVKDSLKIDIDRASKSAIKSVESAKGTVTIKAKSA